MRPAGSAFRLPAWARRTRLCARGETRRGVSQTRLPDVFRRSVTTATTLSHFSKKPRAPRSRGPTTAPYQERVCHSGACPRRHLSVGYRLMLGEYLDATIWKNV